jgi:hypothetical protein
LFRPVLPRPALQSLAGIPVALLGVLDPVGALPIPFLLGCLWTLAVGVVLALRESRGTDEPTTWAPAEGSLVK